MKGCHCRSQWETFKVEKLENALVHDAERKRIKAQSGQSQDSA
jgi:hypothetical protein